MRKIFFISIVTFCINANHLFAGCAGVFLSPGQLPPNSIVSSTLTFTGKHYTITINEGDSIPLVGSYPLCDAMPSFGGIVSLDWYKDGVIFKTTTAIWAGSQSIYVKEEGLYTVTFHGAGTSISNLSNSSQIRVVVNKTPPTITGINENTSNAETTHLTLYPNPIKASFLQVKTDNEYSNVVFDIYSIDGAKIFSNSYETFSEKSTIDLPPLSNRIYFFYLKTENAILFRQKMAVTQD